jgi:hypothetical protein
MKRAGVALVTMSLALALLPRSPAHAGGVWDPNEPIHRLDIRWIGAYEQADGRLRVTVTFYDPVRLRWFAPADISSLHRMTVWFAEDRHALPGIVIAVFARRGNRLVAGMCVDGSGCGSGILRRPDRYTLRAWFDPFDLLPHAGFVFRGRSIRPRGSLLDRTELGTVT